MAYDPAMHSSGQSDSPTASGRLARWGIGIAALVIPLTTIVSHSFGRSTYPLLLPAIKDDLAITNTQAGFGGGATFVAYLGGVLIVTLVAGRFEPLRIMKAGLSISAIGLAILAGATSFPLVLLGLALLSSGGAGIWLSAPVLATQGVEPRRRGVVIGMLTGTIGLATSLVAVGTRGARSFTDNPELWRPVYLVECGGALLILLIVSRSLRTQTTERLPAGRISSEGLRSVPGWLPVTLAYIAFGAIAAGYSTFLAEALETDGDISRDSVTTIYLGLGLASLIGAPLIGWISDQLGRRTAMLGVMSIIGAACIGVATLKGPSLVLVVILFGGLWVSYPTLTATYVRDHLNDRQFGSAFGLMTIFFGIAAIVPPFAAGAVADDRGSFTLPYLAFGGLAVVGFIALLFAPGRAAQTPIG